MGFFNQGGGGFYESFTPPKYDFERGMINPQLWGWMQQGMKGKPQAEDWQWLTGINQTIGQNYEDAWKQWRGNYAGRGVLDSGWTGQKQAGLLGQRAGQESEALAQMYQNIMARKLQAQQLTGGYLGQARAGSGTYTMKG